jgi:hypothetical protein
MWRVSLLGGAKMNITIKDGAVVVDEGPGGNYVRALERMLRKRKVREGVFQVDVYHDGWCKFRTGKCNCKPDITAIELEVKGMDQADD